VIADLRAVPVRSAALQARNLKVTLARKTNAYRNQDAVECGSELLGITVTGIVPLHDSLILLIISQT